MKYWLVFVYLISAFLVKAEEQDSTKIQRVYSLLDKGLVFNLNSPRADSAIVYLDSAFELAQSYGIPKPLAECYLEYGRYHRVRADFDSALKYFDLALSITLDKNLKTTEGKTRVNLGDINLHLGNVDGASSHYKHVVQIGEETNNSAMISAGNLRLALIEYERNNLSQSHMYFKEAYDHADGYGERADLQRVDVLYKWSLAYIKEEKHDEALEILKRAISIDSLINKNDESISVNSLGYVYYQMGRIYKIKQDYKNALYSFNKAFSISQKFNFELTIMEYLNREISILYDSLHQPQKALEHYKLSIQWRDSLKKQEAFQTIQDLNIKYGSLEKELENEKLSKEKALAKADAEKANEKEQTSRNYLILGSILAILVIGFLFILIRQKNKSNLQLKEKNIQISNSLKEREILIREIHHRVKNNFQLVSSILKIQAGNVNDDNAKTQLLDSRGKILSMAMVHQRLYGQTNIGEIDTKVYFEDLIEELMVVYNKTNLHGVEIDKKIDHVWLDTDQTLTCGIIMTELLSNSFKHAFTSDNNGQNKVSINLSRENEDSIMLEVKDNGTGIDPNNTKKKTSFGLQLIELLSKNIHADFVMKQDKGLTARLNIPIAKTT